MEKYKEHHTVIQNIIYKQFKRTQNIHRNKKKEQK